MRGLPKLEPYVPVYQDKHINAYAYITPHAIAGKDVNSELDNNGNFVISRDNTLFFFDPACVAIYGRTQQLMMFYIERFTKAIRHGCTEGQALNHKKIKFTVSEVAREFNLSSKQARRLIISSSTAMQMMVIQWEDNLRGKKILHSSNIIQGFDYYRPDKENDLKHGEVTVTLADGFATILPQLYIMWYPRSIRKISLRRYPSANAFALKLASVYNMNFSKDNRGTVSVPTLLSVTQEIPNYEKLQDGAGQLQKRIINPFVRTLDALVDNGVLSGWQLVYDGNVVPQEEYKGLRYTKFSECNVVYEMANFPKEKRLAQRNDLLEKRT